jgi:salicylate synthetase
MSLKSAFTTTFPAKNTRPVNTQRHEEEYKILVSSTISEIGAGEYTKVIVSRAIDLQLNHRGFQATGFSPELMTATHHGVAVRTLNILLFHVLITRLYPIFKFC